MNIYRVELKYYNQNVGPIEQSCARVVAANPGAAMEQCWKKLYSQAFDNKDRRSKKDLRGSLKAVVELVGKESKEQKRERQGARKRKPRAAVNDDRVLDVDRKTLAAEPERKNDV